MLSKILASLFTLIVIIVVVSVIIAHGGYTSLF